LSRVKAALTHLLISVFAFSIFLSFVFFIWYSYPFNITEGVGDIVYLMAGIDIVLGPLLTLVVFKAGKKGLKIDLTLIGLVQIAALIYGGHVIYSERPAWLVFAKDRFEVVGLVEIDTSKIQDKNLLVGIFDRPKKVYAESPVGERATDIALQAMQGGADIDRIPELYRVYEPYKTEVVMASKGFSRHVDLQNETESNGKKWLPVEGKQKNIIAILDVNSSSIAGYKVLDPWNLVSAE